MNAYFGALLLMSVCLGAVKTAAQELHCLTPRSASDLQRLLRHSDQRLPLVSAHRGGAGKGLPENCLATFEATLQVTYALLEVDPRMTKDGAIVLHHDEKLERTTNGTGRVADHTLEELKRLRLKDLHGDLTEYTMPTLDETLEWARGKAILVLDQKDVSVELRAQKILEHHAEGYAMLIVGNYQDVKECHAKYPQLMMEVFVGNATKVKQFDALGVPWTHVMPFVGHELPADVEVIDLLHQRHAVAVVGTSRNLDRELVKVVETDRPQFMDRYRSIFNQSIDLIETDTPRELGRGLFEQTPIPDEVADLFAKRLPNK